MEKLSQYLLIMSGMVLVFYFMGLITDTSSSTLLTLLLSPEGFKNTSLMGLVGLSMSMVGFTTAVIVGFLNNNTELIVSYGAAILLLNYGWDFLKVYLVMYSANAVLAILIFSPVLFLYTFTVFDWWRGRE